MSKDTFKEKTAIEQMEEALLTFWRDYGRSRAVKALHTEVEIKPRIFLGNEINPEIMKLLIIVFLSQAKIEDILYGRIIVSPEKVIINDDSGRKLAEVANPRLIAGMINQVTHELGIELVSRDYIEAKEKGYYSYGDIKDALVKFMTECEKHDSKNLIKEAAKVLLVKN